MRSVAPCLLAAGLLFWACVPPTEPSPSASAEGGVSGGASSNPSAGSGGSQAGTAGAAGVGAGGASGAGSGDPDNGGPGQAGGAAGASTPGRDAAPSLSDAGPGSDTGAPAAPGGSANGLAQLLQSGSIGLGYYTACHILPDHSVRCFGDRHPRTMPPAGIKPTQISCAHDGCCALLPPGSDTRIRCWSDKRNIFPPDQLARSVDPVQLAIGYQHGCVVNADHSVRCWGQPGTMNEPPEGLRAKSIAVAAYFNCAVTMDDGVVCWGINAPQPPPDLEAKLVTVIFHGSGHLGAEARAGTRHACAIQLDDRVRCWGDDVDGTTAVPPDLGPVKDIAAIAYSTCAIRLDGRPVCWGTRIYQPDDPSQRDPNRLNPMAQGLELKGIRGNYAAYCALRTDDTIVCWGDEKTSHLSVPEGLELFVPPLAP